MKRMKVLLPLVLLLTGCGSRATVAAAIAPSIICESHYEAPAGEGFNLLEWINIKSGTNKKPHVSMRGNLDNAVPGDYKVMLTAYDDIGNMTIRNVSIKITEPLPEPEPEAEPEETPAPDETPEVTPEPTPTPEPTLKPATTAAPSAQTSTPAPVQNTDPYAQAKRECAESWGTWNGTSCVWPTPEPATPAAPANLPSGGQTTCWQEGGMTVCEWVSDWEEYYE